MCTHKDCTKKGYRNNLCREHFCSFIRNSLRKTFSTVYKSPYVAFGQIDPEAKGYIELNDILNSFVVNRSGLNSDDITKFFEIQNIFKGSEGRMIYAKFREMFFPHMTLAGEDPLLYQGF